MLGRSITVALAIGSVTAVATAQPTPAEPAPVEPAPVEPDPVSPPPAATDDGTTPPAAATVPQQPVAPAMTATGTSMDEDLVGLDAGVVVARPRKGPRIAFELSGTGSYTANPYIEYRGWTLETGANRGVRAELNLIGIQLAYELSTMANQDACNDAGCQPGAYGSTRIHALELGTRLRLLRTGPVRTFVTASLGAAFVNAGQWSARTDKTTLGGVGRIGFGIELPLLDRFFASASLAYRVVVTPNPLRDEGEEMAMQLLLGGSDPPSGDYAEDLHLVSGYLGFGVEL